MLHILGYRVPDMPQAKNVCCVKCTYQFCSSTCHFLDVTNIIVRLSLSSKLELDPHFSLTLMAKGIRLVYYSNITGNIVIKHRGTKSGNKTQGNQRFFVSIDGLDCYGPP